MNYACVFCSRFRLKPNPKYSLKLCNRQVFSRGTMKKGKKGWQYIVFPELHLKTTFNVTEELHKCLMSQMCKLTMQWILFKHYWKNNRLFLLLSSFHLHFVQGCYYKPIAATEMDMRMFKDLSAGRIERFGTPVV